MSITAISEGTKRVLEQLNKTWDICVRALPSRSSLIVKAIALSGTSSSEAHCGEGLFLLYTLYR